MKRLFCLQFAIIALALATISVSAQSSIAGEWDGQFETPGGARPFKLVLAVDGEKITGTAKRASGDVPVEGTIKGNDVTFAYTINYGGNMLTMTFTGKLNGDKMSGTVSFGGNAEESWSASRKSSSPK